MELAMFQPQQTIKLYKIWLQHILQHLKLFQLDKNDNPSMIRYAAHSIGISSITLETEETTYL